MRVFQLLRPVIMFWVYTVWSPGGKTSIASSSLNSVTSVIVRGGGDVGVVGRVKRGRTIKRTAFIGMEEDNERCYTALDSIEYNGKLGKIPSLIVRLPRSNLAEITPPSWAFDSILMQTFPSLLAVISRLESVIPHSAHDQIIHVPLFRVASLRILHLGHLQCCTATRKFRLSIVFEALIPPAYGSMRTGIVTSSEDQM